MFDLENAVQQAEAGDVALWEDIARHLLKAKKPKKTRKQTGDYVWSAVTFKDGVTVLVGGYGLDPTSQAAHDKAARLRAGVMSGRWFDRAWFSMIPPTVEARAVAPDQLESVRETAYRQRVEGWGKDAWSTVCGSGTIDRKAERIAKAVAQAKAREMA